MKPSRLSRVRSRWWPAAIVVILLLVAAAALSSQLGSDGRAEEPSQDDSADPNRGVDVAPTASEVEETSADAAASDEDAASAVTNATAEALADSAPSVAGDEPTEADDESGTELSEAFGEPEHPVSGVEPYIPSRIRLDEPGLPAAVCRGVLPAQRVQLPLRFASTKPEGVDHLSWSPDCRHMVFRVGRTLWVANGDGTGDMPFLTAQHGLSNPAWSPDGEWIAFSQDVIVDGERASQIFVVKPSGLGIAEVAWGGLVLDRAPSWSPDGTRIAFSRRVWAADDDGADSIDQHLVMIELATDLDWITDAADGGASAVHTGRRWELAAGGEHESWPSWSPDGESIAYRNGDELILLRLDDLSQYVLLDGVVGGRGSWSPDGSLIAAVTEWSDGRATVAVRSVRDPGTTEEYVIAVDGPAATASGNAPTLRWSETGDHLLFHATDPRGSHWAYLVPIHQPGP